jgi:cbb3-type cytochrome c oxidase subunit III
MKVVRLFVTAVTGAALLALGLAAGAPSAGAIETAPLAGPMAADGAAVWQKECKKCHGEDGKGKTKMGEKHKIPDLTAAEWQGGHDKAKVVSIVTDGKADTKMKAFKDQLSAEDIEAVATYVKALKP